MYRPALIASLSLFVTALSPAATVQDLRVNPNVSYSATRIMDAGGQRMEQQYFHKDLTRNRSDTVQNGQTTSMIMRADLDQLLLVMPAQKMYMELSLQDPQARAQSPGLPAQETITEFELVGREDVNGVRAEKYLVTSTTPRGGTTRGHFWISADDRIVVKMDLSEGENRTAMELQNLRVGAQPDNLFEVPAGYRKVTMGGGLGGMFGAGMPGAGGAAPGAADATPPAAAPAGADQPTFAEEVANDAAEETKQTTRDEVRRGVRDTVSEGLRGIFRR